MELLVVVIIVGTITAFAVPNYAKAVQRSEERRILNELYTLHAALVTYKAKHGVYPTADIAETNPAATTYDHANFNSILGVNMTPSPNKFEYLVVSGADKNKVTIFSQYGWGIHFHSNISPSCTSPAMHCTGWCKNGGTSPANCPPCPTCGDSSVCGCVKMTYNP